MFLYDLITTRAFLCAGTGVEEKERENMMKTLQSRSVRAQEVGSSVM